MLFRTYTDKMRQVCSLLKREHAEASHNAATIPYSLNFQDVAKVQV